MMFLRGALVSRVCCRARRRGGADSMPRAATPCFLHRAKQGFLGRRVGRFIVTEDWRGNPSASQRGSALGHRKGVL